MNLSEVVEVVLAVDPAVRRSLVDTVGFVADFLHVWAVAVVKRALEKLHRQTPLVSRNNTIGQNILSPREGIRPTLNPI